MTRSHQAVDRMPLFVIGCKTKDGNAFCARGWCDIGASFIVCASVLRSIYLTSAHLRRSHLHRGIRCGVRWGSPGDSIEQSSCLYIFAAAYVPLEKWSQCVMLCISWLKRSK